MKQKLPVSAWKLPLQGSVLNGRLAVISAEAANSHLLAETFRKQF